MTEELCGCDTFVVMGDLTSSGEIIFGKNSDRPSGEVQEIVHNPAQEYPPGIPDFSLKAEFSPFDT